MRLRTARALVRTSRPKMRAVPAEGLWNPSKVLSSVDLPAPFGPSRPMARPFSETLRFLRMARLPNRTSSPSSSMTGSITSRYDVCGGGVPGEWTAWVCPDGTSALPPCPVQLPDRQRTPDDSREIPGKQAHKARFGRGQRLAVGGEGDLIPAGVGGEQQRFHIAEPFQREVAAAAGAHESAQQASERPRFSYTSAE